MAKPDEELELRVALSALVDHAMCEGERYTKEGRQLAIEWAHRRDTLIREHADEILNMLRRGGWAALEEAGASASASASEASRTEG